jgi:hypothetical protein
MKWNARAVCSNSSRRHYCWLLWIKFLSRSDPRDGYAYLNCCHLNNSKGDRRRRRSRPLVGAVQAMRQRLLFACTCFLCKYSVRITCHSAARKPHETLASSLAARDRTTEACSVLGGESTQKSTCVYFGASYGSNVGKLHAPRGKACVVPRAASGMAPTGSTAVTREAACGVRPASGRPR